MFGVLDPTDQDRKRGGATFAIGLLIESLVIGAAIFFGMLFPDELPLTTKHYAVVWLSLPKPPVNPVLKLPPKVVRVFFPRLKLPDLSTPAVVHLEIPKTRPAISAVAITVAEAPLPPPPVPPPNPSPKVQIEVHTGAFAGESERVTTKRPFEQVQTGGFGSPQGFAGRAQGDSLGNVPKLGSFGLPDGPGVGNGTGGAHGVQGVVASAGFGSAVAMPGYGHDHGGTEERRVAAGGFENVGAAAPSSAENRKVAIAGFENASPATPPKAERSNVAPPTEFQPVEIFSKPSPAYTEEARRLRIQGEVALAVVFQASGAIRVIGVVQSLGHGLDQAAKQAVTQIRFKPAQRDGKPTDFPATLRIQFRLADQSS